MTSNAKPDHGAVIAFIRRLHPEILRDSRIMISYQNPYTRGTNPNPWYCESAKSIEHAAGIIMTKNSGGHDVWIGACQMPENLERGQRGTAEMATSCGSVWLDLDMESPAHPARPGQSLPKTESDLLGLIAEMPLRPSTVIRTGNGMQAWWILKEPLDLREEKNRRRMRIILSGWQRIVANQGSRKGWTIGGVHDLARVMRVPGTLYRKHGCEPFMMFELLQFSGGCDYAISDIEDYTGGLELEEKVAAREIELDVEDDASVAVDVIEALVSGTPEFARLWSRQGGKRYPSDSEWDMALAALLYKSNPEIKDQLVYQILLHYRERWGGKRHPRKWYENTLNKARAFAKEKGLLSRAKAGARADIATENLSGNLANMELSVVKGASAEHDERRILIDELSNALGFAITRIERVPFGQSSSYRIYCEHGRITLDNTESLLGWRKFVTAYVDACKSMPPNDRSKQWAGICDAMVRAAVDVPPGFETTDSGMTHALLAAYFSAPINRIRGPEPIELVEAWGRQRPFTEDGSSVGFYFMDFLAFLKRSQNISPTMQPRALGIALESVGCCSVKKEINGDQINIWTLPESLAAKFLGKQNEKKARNRQTA